ncbi:hypothetical protein F5B19DRAFT_439760 [Rostrohypoxylon terebratum]|nr:hypothetical protein F5B19DRAFT_439760 [Rostrohypoxylon terebratum]
MSDTAAPLPAWVYENKQGTVIGPVVLFSVLAIIAVILRFKCRSLARANIGPDDWLILAALPVAVADAVVVAYSTKDGLGRHQQLVSKPALREGGEIFFTIQILWAISSSLVKLSILFFYQRVFGILRYVRFIAWFLIALVIIWMIGVTIAHALECTPIAKSWDVSLPGHCLDTVSLYMVGSISDVVMDFLILILPLPAIARLQMPMSRKIELVLIFALGGLTCVLSLVRFLGAKKVIYDKEDITWISSFPLVWAAAEPCLGTVCACLPMLQPLMQGLKERVMKMSSTATSLTPSSKNVSNKARSSWKPRFPNREQNVHIQIPDWSEESLQETLRNRGWAGEV